MLSTLRGLLENWVARGFFVLLVVVFVFWGISNVFTLGGGGTSLARIGGQPVDAAQVQEVYQTALNNAQQSGTPPDAAGRQQLALAALNEVLRTQTVELESRHLGLAAPDAAVRRLIYAIPAFQVNGVFSKTQFQAVLQANDRTPAQFVADVRQNLLERQLLVPILAGAAAPADLTTQIYNYVAEQREAETVSIAAAAAPTPRPPASAVLQRYWRNHQAAFTAPEFRTIKLVLLSPALLAPHEPVSDADIAAAYARATQGQTAVPLRSVQVLSVVKPAVAERLAAAWRDNAGWASVQAMAKSEKGVTAVELDAAKATEIPTAALSTAVFAAMPGEVVGPVQGPFSLFVFKVTAISNSMPTQASVQAKILQALQLEAAQAEVARDVDNVQDALAGQKPLDQLPGNLGLTALTGTLDAAGNTPDGTTAPIPGGADLAAAVVKTAFATAPRQPAQLLNGPDGSYYALTVDAVIPPSVAPFDQVQSLVAAAWTADQKTRAAEVQAADLLAAVNGGQSLDVAASAVGDAVTMTPPITRQTPAPGLPPQLSQLLFTMQPGQATMQQTDTGFIVAMLARVSRPSPQQDPSDFASAQNAMTKSTQDDMASSFIAGLQAKDNISVNQKLFAQIYQ